MQSHDSGKNMKGSGKDKVMQYVQHILTLMLTHGCLG